MDGHSLECLDFYRVREILAGYGMTALGKSLAANIRPNTRVELVRRWLAQVVEMQTLSEQRGLPPFGGVSDVREVVKSCAPPLRVSVEQMAAIGNTLAATHALTCYFADLGDSYPELRHLVDRIGNFRTIADRIRAVIDERAKVRDDASPKLQGIRRKMNEAAARIEQTVQRLLRDPALRKLLQYPNHTFHNDRLVLPVKTEHRGRLPGIVHRTSDSGATLYVEPADAVELNNQLSNLRSEEEEEIARILWDLAHEVHLNEAAILKTLDAVAVLDLLVAKVRFARDFELHCPKISEDGVLNVRRARHPLLLDLAKRKAAAGETPLEVVPIDYRLGDDFDMLIITGPNTGGKTVALKTVGLLCLMVQAGLPVPVAEGSSMCVFYNVLIDVGDEQSMQQSLSTFSAHLKRLMDMLRRAGERTIVLIDELGAGTDPDEGAAIGRAILDELLRLRCRCIATTHLGALKGFALTRDRAENACVEFDSKTLQPKYRLHIGEPGESNAIDIAQRLGMSRRLITAARRNLSRKGRALRAAIAGTLTSKRQAEEARAAAESARRQADRATVDADAAKATLEQQQADFEQWVARVVHLQPGDPVRVRDFDRDGRIVRIRIDQQRAEVDVGAFAVEVPLGDVLPPETPSPPARAPRPMTRPVGGDGVRKTKPKRTQRPDRARSAPRPKQHEAKLRAKIPALTDEQAAALRPGDLVYAKRFHRAGPIVRLKPAKRIAIVSVGVLEIELPYDGLALPGAAAAAVREAESRVKTKADTKPSGSPAEPVAIEARAPDAGAVQAAAPPPDKSQVSEPESTPRETEAQSSEPTPNLTPAKDVEPATPAPTPPATDETGAAAVGG